MQSLLAGPHTREASERQRVSASRRGHRAPGLARVPRHWPRPLLEAAETVSEAH